MTAFEQLQTDAEGPAAVPRKNGELVFEAPWEGRVLGLAVALSDRRFYEWDDFRSRLVEQIAMDEQAPYYTSWLAAFEKLLVDRGVMTPDELERRTADYASGERDDEDHDHDDDEHDHGHSHGHGHGDSHA